MGVEKTNDYWSKLEFGSPKAAKTLILRTNSYKFNTFSS